MPPKKIEDSTNELIPTYDSHAPSKNLDDLLSEDDDETIDDIDGDDGDENESDGELNDDLEIIDDGPDDGGDDDDCAYPKKGKKKTSAIGLDKEIYIDDPDDTTITNALPDEYRPPRHLYNYERVRILGDRAAQLAQGAKPLIKGDILGLDERTIAQLELESGQIPFKIRRTMPDGKCEEIKVSDLKLKPRYIKYGFLNSTSINGSIKKHINHVNDQHHTGGHIMGYNHLTTETGVIPNTKSMKF
jgi:DNA-directed RNA polymerase subunit K/omega